LYIAVGIFTLKANVWLYIGSKKERRGFFIPWLIIEIIGIAGLLANAIVYFVLADDIAANLQLDHSVIIVIGVLILLFMSQYKFLV
jgi:hypothetical protein